jgi:hypothetical protein
VSVVGSPVILSGTVPQPIPAPSSSGGYIGVQVFNNSAYSIQVQIGAQSFIVGPQTSTFAPIGGGTTLVEASLLSSGQVATIYATWFNQGDPTPAAMSSYALNTGVVNITGGTVDATITSGTVNANITNASIPVSGTVNASITNATVPVSGSVSADITNATLQVAGTVDATLTGPVGISQGSTINIVNSVAGGQTPMNSTATTSTSNASLDQTNYNLISWAAVPLPAGSSGNQVYDSNLTNAIASVGATWTLVNGGTLGTANGDFNVLNGGTNSAEWVYYGTGSTESEAGTLSQPFDYIPGTTYTASAVVSNASAITAGVLQLMLYQNEGFTGDLADFSSSTTGTISFTFTAPSAGETLQLGYRIPGGQATVTAGQAVGLSQIQLTETSTVQPYEPGPLWNYLVFKQDGSNFYLLGQTTALAFEDTGQLVGSAQPYSVNTTYPQISSPSAPTITVEGTAGTTTATYGIAAQTSQAQGTVALAANPGVEIGTMDIAPGAQVQLAAGTAVIGTVNAQGQVDVGTIDTITAGSLSIVNQPGINIPSGSEHNYSMTMATAGTSYTAAPAVSTRAFFLIQNASGNNLYFGFGSLGNIFELGPLQGYEEASGKNPLITLAITVKGTIDSQPVSIVTWE